MSGADPRTYGRSVAAGTRTSGDDESLASWGDGTARRTLLAFLEASADIDPHRRLAVFDNDGTLWCERPDYIQAGFLASVLRTAAARDPALRCRPEYAAILDGDHDATADLGLARVALALLELLDDMTPDAHAEQVRTYLARAHNPVLGRPVALTIYRPMVELLDALRAHGFTVGIVTGGGADFVRALSDDLYGVPSELVVGTMIEYRYCDRDGVPVIRRTRRVAGEVNEGAAKVTAIQTQLGRQPLLAAGNTPGDLEMLTVAADQPGGLALVIDHDDAIREFAYAGGAASFESDETLAAIATRRGWTTVSMRDDWTRIWP